MKKLLVFISVFSFLSVLNAVDTKVSDLTEDTAPTTDDLLYTVTDPGGTPASRKATIANVLNNAIKEQDTLQSGATFYVSSGTVESGLRVNGELNPAGGVTDGTLEEADIGDLSHTSLSGVILLQETLQSGATFFVSSGTVSGTSTVFSVVSAGANTAAVRVEAGITQRALDLEKGGLTTQPILRLHNRTPTSLVFIDVLINDLIAGRISFDDTDVTISAADGGGGLALNFLVDDAANGFQFRDVSDSSDISMTFNASGNDGVYTWGQASDEFQYSDDINLLAEEELRLSDSDSSNYVSFRSSAAMTTNVDFVMPASTTSAVVNEALIIATIEGDDVVLSFEAVILEQETLQSGATFYVSSGTIETELNVPADTIDAIAEIASGLKSGSDATLVTGTSGSTGECAQWDSNGDLITSGAGCGGGGGASVLAVTTGTATKFDVVTSSPTAVVNFSSTSFSVQLTGTATAYVSLDGDHGDFTYTSADELATLDADVVASAEMGDSDHGDVSWTSNVATVDSVAAANIAAGSLGGSVLASSIAVVSVGTQQVIDG